MSWQQLILELVKQLFNYLKKGGRMSRFRHRRRFHRRRGRGGRTRHKRVYTVSRGGIRL